MVRMPRELDTLPVQGETRTGVPVLGGVFQTLAENANYLAQWKFKHAISLVVSAYNQDAGNYISASAQIVRIPLHTEDTKQVLVAVGIAACSNTGTIQASVQVAPAQDAAGHSVPGTGVIVDQGCLWSAAAGDLVSPVENGVYNHWGLRWFHTGAMKPSAVNPLIDPVSPAPRMLHVQPYSDQEITISYTNCALCSVLVWEAHRPFV